MAEHSDQSIRFGEEDVILLIVNGLCKEVFQEPSMEFAIDAQMCQERATILATHHQYLLGHVVPGRVHILDSGHVATSGRHGLALGLEFKGCEWVTGA